MVALAATALGAAAIVRSQPAGQPTGGRAPDYREAVVAPKRPLILNPLMASRDQASRDVAHLLARALLRLDNRAQPVPDLALSWGVTGEGLVYRFALAAATRWSDGTAVSSSDVTATVAAVQRPDFPDAALASAWQGVTVAAESPGVVSFTLPAPRAAFAVTVVNLPIVPAAVARQPTAALVAGEHGSLPSSGPMRVRSADSDTVELVGNPLFSPRPPLASMELRLEPTFDAAAHALANGQVDALAATTPEERAALVGLHGVQVHDWTSFRFTDLLLDSRRAGLADPVVRLAVAGAVDRRALIAAALPGAATPQVDAIPAGITWVGAVTPEHPDISLAARALDAAGWLRDPATGIRSRAGITLGFTLSVSDVAPLPAVGRELALQLAVIGISVTVQLLAADRFDATVLGSTGWDMALAEWDNGADPDISAYWRSNAIPPSGFNVSGLPPDPFLDHALDTLATELDPQLRAEAAQRVDQQLADNAPAVFLYAPKVSFVTSSAISGVTVPTGGTSAARYDSVAGWRHG